MGALLPLLLLAVAANAVLLATPSQALTQDGLHLLDAKRALTVPDGALADWNPTAATPCAWTGVTCDAAGAVTALSLANANLAGPFPPSLCRIPRLAALDLSANYLGPEVAVAGCKALARLDLSVNSFVGPLPAALAGLPELLYLSLEGNNFSGPIPASFGAFPKLESLSLVNNLLGGEVPAFLGSVATLRELNLSYNPFSPGPLPSSLGGLAALRVLWLAGCNLVGPIPASLGRLRNLTDLDLSTNSLTGPIPPALTALTSAVQIELYNNSLSGAIPSGFGKLADLRSMDLAMNRLDGAIPADLFESPKLETLHLYSNALTGPVPDSAAKAASLVELRLFANRLNGTLPADLGRATPLVCLDVSDNAISGEIPRGVCDRGELEELLMLNNALTGRIPDGLGRCHRLRRVRLSNNSLDGDVPGAVWGLPHIALLELNDNRLTGEISPVIAGAANLSNLVVSNNRLTGRIPSEIGSVAKLYEFSADGNMLSGPLPSSLGGLAELGRLVLHNNSLSGQLLRGIHSWKKLSELNLADNGFTGAIPPELGDLPVLNYLDLSGNRLTGQVPVELENLKLNQFNVSNNQLSGQLPPQYATEAYRGSFLGNPGLCGDIAGLCSDSQGGARNRSGFVWMMRSIFIFAAVVLVLGVAWFYWRYRSFKKAKLSAERSKWTLTSFHKVSFSEHDILDCLDEDNVIGSGASGKVYKAVLGNGEVVAVKKLWGTAPKKKDAAESNGDNEGSAAAAADSSFDAEVRTLSKIRHKNIVKLLCCCTHDDSKLLVYEYMPNGSLGDVLHSSKAGLLDWSTRFKIALDAAEGLSYLHQDCVPAIVHRDVKSNNILLDAEFSACVADFGVAKVVETAGRAPKSMSVIAGSCGYIAPEYAYTLRVNEKSDIYIFGVVLLELVTGKPPVDPEFGEKDLVKWVCSTIDQKGVEHVLDSRLDMSFKEEISRVLNIGLICASSLPINRPAMRRVVKMLQEVRAEARLKLEPYYYDDTSDQGSSV
ncbi:receptor-like protein kinase HSL1 [Lolium rigidum]|uniref:receptor-like protein kinase HSL1 n=1 Tax=Lolium rigidum TaxID=89674 RepID=UPI001F5D9315|nr:receptor-like protein kinase HSL1 [Lolium rigidum]